MPEGKNHGIERNHSKRGSKTSICKIGNYFWDSTIDRIEKICFYTEELFVRINGKNEWKFSIILFWNWKSRDFITQISILNTKYYESPFKKLRVVNNDIMITKLSKNNFHKSNDKYYNLEIIFEKFILRGSINKSFEKDRKTNYFL